MGHLLRSLAVVAALAAGTPPLLAFEGPALPGGDSKKAPAKAEKAPAKAEKAPQAPGGKPDAAGAKPDAANDNPTVTAQRLIDAGIEAYNAGKADLALRAFDSAITGGALAPPQLARALYFRGLTYRKKGKPGLAIPDLTSAIWLKDGLSAADKQEAMSNRVAAYRDAGIADVPDELPQPGAGGSFGADGWQTAMGSAQPPAAAAAASASRPSPPPPAAAPASAPQTATYVPARPPPPPESSHSNSSGGIGGFFKSVTNLFGGGSSGSSGSSGNASDVTTASIAPPVAANWSQTTEIAAAPPPPPAAPAAPAPRAAEPAPAAVQPAAVEAPVQQAPAPPPQAAPVPVAAPAAPVPVAAPTQVSAVAPPVAEQPQAQGAPTGKYHVQVAAVRSRSEAYALSVRLLSQHASELGARKPEVDQAVIGSMGTFYRVKVGPYASAEESQQLCGSLRASGFDCLITTQ